MSATKVTPVSAVLALVAPLLAYGLWVLSGIIEDWVGQPVLLPVIRLGIVIVGLSFADVLYRQAERLFALR